MSDKRQRVPRKVRSDEGPPKKSVTHENLTKRLTVMQRDYPAAIDLLTGALDAFYGPLYLAATIVSPVTSAKRFREGGRGERPLSLDVVAYLAILPQKEPREAVLALVTYFALALGYRLEPMGEPHVGVHIALAEVVTTGCGVVAHLSLAISNDGKLGSVEAKALDPKIAAAKMAMAGLEALSSLAQRGEDVA